jgi:hypothetical protein
MDVFKNPDEVIKEVEDNEERVVEEEQVKREVDESPEDQVDDPNPSEG